ncbi:UNVERIFIED_ORG: hypothetical protein E4P37_05650, partial [Bacillus sp. AZ43]
RPPRRPPRPRRRRPLRPPGRVRPPPAGGSPCRRCRRSPGRSRDGARCRTRTSRRSSTSRSSSRADGRKVVLDEHHSGRPVVGTTPQGRHRSAGRPLRVAVRLVQPR